MHSKASYLSFLVTFLSRTIGIQGCKFGLTGYQTGSVRPKLAEPGSAEPFGRTIWPNSEPNQGLVVH